MAMSEEQFLDSINIMRDSIDKCFLEMLDNHKLKIEDLKKGDIEKIYHQPTKITYLVLFKKYCYKEVFEYNDNKIIYKLIPAQEFLINNNGL